MQTRDAVQCTRPDCLGPRPAPAGKAAPPIRRGTVHGHVCSAGGGIVVVSTKKVFFCLLSMAIFSICPYLSAHRPTSLRSASDRTTAGAGPPDRVQYISCKGLTLYIEIVCIYKYIWDDHRLLWRYCSLFHVRRFMFGPQVTVRTGLKRDKENFSLKSMQ